MQILLGKEVSKLNKVFKINFENEAFSLANLYKNELSIVFLRQLNKCSNTLINEFLITFYPRKEESFLNSKFLANYYLKN